MCHRCNYNQLLVSAGLKASPNRLRILEVVGSNGFPLSAGDIFETIGRGQPINRVTVYRILDLLVERGLLKRISTGGRAFCYDLAPNKHHRPHPHFYCKHCGHMTCLSPESLPVDMKPLEKIFPGRIDNVEIRVDGLCKNCLRSKSTP
jgi:Fur family ferric uptake transcriptional regulator